MGSRVVIEWKYHAFYPGNKFRWGIEERDLVLCFIQTCSNMIFVFGFVSPSGRNYSNIRYMLEIR